MRDKQDAVAAGKGSADRMQRYFLPAGIALALLAGLALPATGRAMAELRFNGLGARMAAVVVIFFVTGLRLEHAQLRNQRGFPRAAAAAVILNLLFAPALATGAGALLGMSGALLIGLLVVGAVPTTLSSSTVITQTAGGNGAWAVSFVVLLNLAGIAILPFTLGTCLRTGGIAVDQFALLFKILRLVIVPLGIGLAIQRIFRRPRARIWAYIPSGCVIFIVWLSVSSQRDGLGELGGGVILELLALAAGLHLVLLSAAFLAGRFLGLAAPERRAFAFVGAQKSLPLSVSVLLMLPGGSETIEAATVAAVILYFPQILIDSVLAARLAGKARGGD